MLAAALAAQIAAFTGQPAALDPRLAPPDCATTPVVAWVPPGRGAVSVSCASPGWRLFVPVTTAAAPPRAVPVVRRGDMVAVVAAGPGFRISVAAIAETDAAPGGRLRLRNRATGERLQADIREDGEIWLAGL